MRQPTALIFVLSLAGGPCLADDVDCSAKALGNATQYALNICAQRDAQASDRTLDATYGRLAAVLDDEARAALKKAELAWIAFRDATCAFETTANAGGSMRPMVIAGCRAQAGKARDAALKRYLACQGRGNEDGDCAIAFK